MTEQDNEQKTDFEEAKERYKRIMTAGEAALEYSLQMAEDTEHPRAIEVLAGLIKSLSDTNEKFINLHKIKKDLAEVKRNEAVQIPQGNTTNNYVLTNMSTSELQKKLMKDVTPIEDVIEESDG